MENRQMETKQEEIVIERAGPGGRYEQLACWR